MITYNKDLHHRLHTPIVYMNLFVSVCMERTCPL